MRRPIATDSPVVVKIGTSSLIGGSPGIDIDSINRVVANVDASWNAGHPTVLVTSGAIAAGLPALGLDRRPTDVPGLQVAAAVGQGRLIAMYSAAFAATNRQVGQVLLTRDVLESRERYLNARAALRRMLALGVVPVVNENDTVVVDEVRVGDNDTLAAIASHLIGAGMMILLTDTPGIFAGDPWMSEPAELLHAVRHTDKVLDELRTAKIGGPFGSGGVATKVAAARMAAWSGVPTVVASASEPNVVARAIAGDEVGTWVEPRESGLPARKLWIAFGCPSVGSIEIDSGAARAIDEASRSLLAAGVTAVSGSFAAGAAVEIVHQGEMIAKGLVSMDSGEIERARGKHTSEVGGEVIHRDDLVVLK